MRIDLPRFYDTVQPEEILDRLATFEEILDFKGVPEGKCVQLVATWSEAEQPHGGNNPKQQEIS